jgi:hypothetical protein
MRPVFYVSTKSRTGFRRIFSLDLLRKTGSAPVASASSTAVLGLSSLASTLKRPRLTPSSMAAKIVGYKSVELAKVQTEGASKKKAGKVVPETSSTES